MPTYEYACRACGHVFEIVQKMSDDPLVICPECGGELRKVFTPPAIAFKGSGFYATDHGKQARAPSGSSKDGGDKGEPKKDTPAKGEGAPSSSTPSSTPETKKEDGSS